ncbi:MAG: PD40 domain-containing protein, partial [Flavobacteriales bacterium]|nr:PD40 domain-containing protein [Flavobacteriales bacterium]
MKRQVIFQYIFVLTLFIYSGCLYSQYESRGERYNYTDAEAFYNVGNYYDALPLYELLMQEKKGAVEYQLKAGICHLYLNENPQKAIEYIKAVYDKKPKMINTKYYLAKAYALNYQFKLAKEMYKSAAENGSTEQKNKKEIPHLIEQCNNAIELVKDSLDVEIINLGEQVNSSANEYSPVINADETELIFTYRGEKSIGGRLDKFNKNKLNGSFNEDIYISNFKNNLWEEPISISDSINSNLNEGGIFLSVDDQKLYLFIDTKNASGDIYESIRVGEEWTKPKSLSINSKYWEGHATMFSDGNRMIFSSNRPGGLGGKDLYSAKLQENGSWGEIENLGPTINTMYDEDAPFLHFDGKTFNFSSKGHTSIGGYDIFESEVSKDTSFSKPVNIGYPINTTSDDIFYHVSKNDNVYYSSARKGGFGQNDTYMINVN